MKLVTSQLEIEDISHIHEDYHRIIMFNPSEAYERIYKWSDDMTKSYAQQGKVNKLEFSHYKRNNWIHQELIFPERKDGICACGCGEKLTGRRRRWATDKCREFAFSVYSIISCRVDNIKYIVKAIYGNKCCKCGRTEMDLRKDYGQMNLQLLHLDLDHIIPVYQGGGGCWLGNFQILCRSCHKDKSKNDRLK